MGLSLYWNQPEMTIQIHQQDNGEYKWQIERAGDLRPVGEGQERGLSQAVGVTTASLIGYYKDSLRSAAQMMIRTADHLDVR